MTCFQFDGGSVVLKAHRLVVAVADAGAAARAWVGTADVATYPTTRRTASTATTRTRDNDIVRVKGIPLVPGHSDGQTHRPRGRRVTRYGARDARACSRSRRIHRADP